jgi:predicted dehydrogenase
MAKRLGIGFIGSGFITRFHIQSFLGIRDADVLGVWSPNHSHAEQAASRKKSQSRRGEVPWLD